jgi:antitoxin HigA-1
MGIFDHLPEVDNIALDIIPGDILRERLDSLGISAYRLSKETKIQQTRVSKILKGERSITVDTALRFGKFFGTSAQFWINLQINYDLKVALEKNKSELAEIHHY